MYFTPEAYLFFILSRQGVGQGAVPSPDVALCIPELSSYNKNNDR